MTNPSGTLRSSPSGGLLKGNVGDVLVCLGGDVWQAAPASASGAGPAPANPGDNGAVPVAAGGFLSYLKGTVTGQLLAWSGAAWAASLVANVNVAGNAAIAVSKLGQSAANTNDVLTWNGSAWAPVAPAAGGVSSFNGRAGAVVPATGDYTIGQLAQSGATANQYVSWNGAAWAPATALTSPANPGDNGKVPVVASGDFTYALILNAQVDPAAAIAGTKVSPDFGAQLVKTTGSLALGATPASVGNAIRFSYGFALQVRNSANSGDIQIADFGASTADTLQIGGVLPLILRGVNGLTIRAGGADFLFGSTFFNLPTPTMSMPNTAGELNCGSNAALATTGALLKITGGAAPGAGSIGGAVRMAPGTGATTNGTGGLYTAGYVTPQFQWSDVGIGFLGAAPLARPARVGQLTDNTTGAATGAVAAAPAVYAAANFNDFNASILAKLNGIESVLHNFGLTA